MKLTMSAGGYPWTVILLSDRYAYMAALEKASVNGGPGKFFRNLSWFQANLEIVAVLTGLGGAPMMC